MKSLLLTHFECFFLMLFNIQLEAVSASLFDRNSYTFFRKIFHKRKRRMKIEWEVCELDGLRYDDCAR